MMPREVKACGVRDPADAFMLEALIDGADAVVDFVGVNLVPANPRCVDAATARALVGACRSVVPVGVFADLDVDAVRAAALEAGLGWVQLHGGESPEDVFALSHGFTVIKALTPAALQDLGLLAAYRDAGARRFLFDGPRPGSGQRMAPPAVMLENGALLGVPCWLAGGLRPDNIVDALQRTPVLGADAATGIETAGRFSPQRAIAFARAARSVPSPTRASIALIRSMGANGMTQAQADDGFEETT